MTASTIFTGAEKMLKQLAGPICPIPGPIFDMQASAAVKPETLTLGLSGQCDVECRPAPP